MTVAELVAGGFTFLSGAVLVFFGLAGMEAGKGGYGIGPFPFVKVPTDYGLLTVGFIVSLVGLALATVGLQVLL